MRHHYPIGILLTALTFAGSVRLPAQDNEPANQAVLFIPVGETVYDVFNHVTWLADANLPAQTQPGNQDFLFGLPLCDAPNPPADAPCVNLSGTMNYWSAEQWVLRMNAYQDPTYSHVGYLRHSEWQLPTTPRTDHSCDAKGALGNNFGFGCEANALGYLYKALGFKAPDTAVPIPPDTVGPFINLQPNLYWSNTEGDGTSGSLAAFSFGSGAQDGSTRDDFLYVLPMLKGKRSDATPDSNTGLKPSKDGKTVYDPVEKVTRLADANLAANWLPGSTLDEFDTLGLPLCETPAKPAPCVALDGSMNYASAQDLIEKMNHYDNGAGNPRGYLFQTNWRLPEADPKCQTYNCTGMKNPMGELFYHQLGFVAGEPVVAAPDIPVGPFNHVQPDHYWSCLADRIQDACEAEGSGPDAEFGFSFGNGYLGTARLQADHFVTAYYVGCDPDQSWCQSITFPRITATEYALSSLALSATATSGLAVRFTSKTPNVCAVHGNTASLLLPGICTIEASQPGNESFVSALPIKQTFTVNYVVQTINFPPIKPQKIGTDLHLHATASSGLKVAFSGGSGEEVSPSYIVPICIVSAESVEFLKIGGCAIAAHQAGNDVYAPAPDVERNVSVGPQ